jgi:cyanophycinase-like exopeptidase
MDTSPPKGKIVLMGSGELTATMVEVHKELLSGLTVASNAVFLDTPAGFQLNVDQISEKAVDYFRTRVGFELVVASFKSRESVDTYESKAAFRTLRQAGYILIGPGSPTYTVHQLKDTPVPEIFLQRVRAGGCLAAASAAALTVGRFTLPVYEIYKVGQNPHWADGMDLLSYFGLNLVVIPHWNNAEGGSHDTSCCFMGKSRFAEMVNMLPVDTAVLGLDEHTACIIDFEKREVEVRGIGQVTWQLGANEERFKKGDRFSLGRLQEGRMGSGTPKANGGDAEPPSLPEEGRPPALWEQIHRIEETFHTGLQQHTPEEATRSLLELDRIIWQAHEALEDQHTISQAREKLRDLIVVLGTKLASVPPSETACLMPVVEEMLNLRQRFRENQQWTEADAIRDSLERSNISIEDTPEGSRWHLKS